MKGKGYNTVTPPPNDRAPGLLFWVIYTIDVDAPDAVAAARQASQGMRAPGAPAPVLTVMDNKGHCTTIDLSESRQCNKITPGFVVQRFKEDDSGRLICVHQEFLAGDDVQWQTLQGESIEPPDHAYQPFEMTLTSVTGLRDRLGQVLNGIDVGGEQSRAFSEEIDTLRCLLGELDRQAGQNP